MKKVIIVMVILLGCLGIILCFNPSITYVNTKGYVIPDTYKVSASYTQSEGQTVYLHELVADSMVYSSLFKDYDYETNTAIDTDYPMYTNDGATLSFLFKDFWLVSQDFDFLETYEGLYLTDGHTYNEDLSQADGDEFLLLSLDNGLYMNAQYGSFQGPLGEIEIPANSIIQFTNTNIRFYEYSGGELSYSSIEEVYSGTITIGEHTYDYIDFLKALDLFQEAIEKLEKDDDIYEIQQEIKELLGDEDDKDSSNRGSSGESSTGSSDTSLRDSDEPVTGDGADGDRGSGTTSGNNGSSSSSGSGSSGSGSASGGSGSGSSGSGSGGSGGGSGSASGGGSAGGSGGASSSGGSAGSSGSDSSSGGESFEEGQSNNSGLVGEGNGESPEVPYQVPSVSIANLDSWAYAINGDLIIDDPSGVLRKGVSLTVYGAIKGAGASIGTVDGLKVYSSSGYTGSSAKLRKTFYSGQEFTLNGIEPDAEFYVQYSYSYYALVDNNAGETIYTVVTVVSDFYQISTPTIAASNLPTINLTYDTNFATYSDRMELQNFYVENASAYDEDDTSFANFKLNVLPYISKFTFDFDEEGVNDITISSSTVSKATLEGILFTSSAGSLTSNAKHTYSVTATDKYGNELPLTINHFDDSKYTGVVYTAKKQPSITVEEVENITDSLTVKITISDVDGALTKTGNIPDDLHLIVTDTSGNSTALTGTWDNGDSLASVNNILSLEEPKNGTEYEFTLDSLAFARTYTFSVYGDYNPQPDGVSNPVLGIESEQLFGSSKIYTAAMSSGSVDVAVSLVDSLILDTSAVVGLEITNKSNTEVLALVDELRLTITDTANNKEKVSLVLAESELSKLTIDSVDEDGKPLFEYDTLNERVVISDANGVEVSLVGERDEFTSKSLWELLIVSQIVDTEAGTTSVSDAVQLRIAMDERLLETFTSHSISYQAIVMKSGIEYNIPVTMSASTFQTKKLQPIVEMDDVFIANDILEFIDFNIIDTDNAIVGTDTVDILLYINGNTLLQKVTIYADDNPQNVRFEGLTPGLEYTIEVNASEYNNSSGYANYTTNFTLANYTIIAGSDMQATITLNSLDYVYENRTDKPVFSVTGAQVEAGLNDGTWRVRTDSYTDGLYTEYFSLTDIIGGDDEINVLEISHQPDTKYDGTYNTTTYPDVAAVFWSLNEDGTYTKINADETYGYVSVNTSNVAVMRIPEGASHVRFELGDLTYLKNYGFDIYGYHMDADDSLIVDLEKNETSNTNAYIKDSYENGGAYISPNTQEVSITLGTTGTSTTYRGVMDLPVTPGDVYFVEDYATRYIYYYNQQKEFIGWGNGIARNAMFVVPENVYYISFFVNNSYDFNLYKLAEAKGETGIAQYLLDASIDVYDKKGSLLDDSENSTVYLALERSEVINTEAVGGESYEEVTGDGAQTIIELLLGEDGYTGSLDNYQALLDPNCSYRLSVKAIYNGETITLASQVLETDGALIIINNASDFAMIQRFPYANFLVTADFEVSNYYSFDFYGTIDFDGHTVTYTGPTTAVGYMIRALGNGGVIKNLVFKNASGVIESIVSDNFGTMENILVETVGTVQTQVAGRALVANNNYGTIRGFIVSFGGDVYFSHSYTGIVARYNFGTIENGYIYNQSGQTVIVDDSALIYAGGIVSENYYGSGTLENVYSVYDTYLNLGDTIMGYSITNTNYANQTNHCYHVGDYFTYSESLGKVKTPLTNRRVINNNAVSKSEEIWSISEYDYEPSNNYDDVKTATVSQLGDVSWESQVLIDGFDVEGTVSMGFYPRLEWPTCMEQHQEYRKLPSESQSVIPEIVADKLKEGEVVNNDNATITLTLTNPNKYTIKSIPITGLETTIVSQTTGENDLYEVTLRVSVTNDLLLQEYVSAYAVESIVYNNGSTDRTTTSEYITNNVSFYKTVGSVNDWYSINSNMDWNYRLTSNITFDTFSSITGIMLNGDANSLSTTTAFSGSIDGNGFKISGISLVDVERPFVIYTLDATASIYNLYIEDITLTGKTSGTAQYAGFIRYAQIGSIIEDVHMSHVTISASGYMGALAGYARGTVLNCTFNDINLSLKSNAVTIAMGGIAGYADYGLIENCYVKDVDIEAKSVKGTYGIGGLVGYLNATGVYNSYVQGSITTDGSLAGGAIGKAASVTCKVSNVVTDVEISSTAGSVGGVMGSNGARFTYNIALGDIYAGNSNVHRVVGLNTADAAIYYPGYAYAGQTVNTLPSTDNDDARYLYTSAELATVKTWTDGMSFGSQWSYETVTDGELPKLYYRDTSILLPGQTEGISLPGTASFTVTFEDAGKDATSGTTWYYADVRLASDEMSAQEIITALTNKDITFTIEGVNMSDDALKQGKYTYEFTYIGDEVRLSIKTQEFESAFDTYRLIVSTDDSSITTIIDYGEAIYHEVPDIDTWNKLMLEGHNTTVENFYITGEINFRGDSIISDLMLGHLKGNDDAKFTYLYFATSATVGGNWISTCNGIENIDFIDIACNYTITPTYQESASLIGYCSGDITGCDIQNFTITTEPKSAGRMGLCYEVTGNVDYVTISDVTLTATESTQERSYHGSITGYLYGSYSNITAQNITIDYQYGNYIGGLFGYVNGLGNNGNTVLNQNITLTDVQLTGRNYVGGMVGYSTQSLQLKNITATNIQIEASRTCGGIGGTMYFSSSGNSHNNIIISDSKVASVQSGSDISFNTGGIFGYAQYYGTYYDLIVENVIVEGYGRVGGVVGYYDMPELNGAYVLNTTVTQHHDSSTATTQTGAGGIVGLWCRDNTYTRNVVVRDTAIVADYNAGGLVGSGVDDYQMNIASGYVAEDVTVTAIKDNAGGVIGYHNEFIISDVAVGANVTAMGNNAGGVVGYLHDDNTTQSIDGVYVSGDITASNYVGGVIGYVAADATVTSTNLSGVIVTADLTSGGNAVDVVANFKEPTSYQSAKVGVWDNILINGQTLQSAYREATDTADTTKIALRAGVSMLSASNETATDDDFLLKSTYTTYGFGQLNTSKLLADNETNSTTLSNAQENPYMPFILDITDVTNLTYSDEYNSNAVGILRPEPGERTGATVVYVSGVNQINIETTQDSVTIQVPSDSNKTISVASDATEKNLSLTSNEDDTYTYTFSESDKLGDYYVITLGYDFTSDITVDNVDYTSDDLARTVMTDGSFWYYINQNILTYGTSLSTETRVKTVTNPIHIWQGSVLTSDGKVYQVGALPDNTSTDETTPEEYSEGKVTFGEIQASASPIFASSNYNVYYNFTMASTSSYGYRIFSLGSTAYTVYVAQGVMYDGYLLTKYGEDTYFALLSEVNGKITSYLTPMAAESFDNSHIVQISNTYNYTDPIVVVKYESGKIVVLNYATGEVLHEQLPDTDYGTYALNQINGIAMSLRGSSITQDDSYYNSDATLGNFLSLDGVDGDAETEEAGNGSSTGDDGVDPGVVDIKDQVDGGDELTTVPNNTITSEGDMEDYSEKIGTEESGTTQATNNSVEDETESESLADGAENNGIEADGMGIAEEDTNNGDEIDNTEIATNDSNSPSSISESESELGEPVAQLEENEGAGIADMSGDASSTATSPDTKDGYDAGTVSVNGDSTDGDDSSDTEASEEESGSAGNGGSATGEDDTIDGTTESDETATGADGNGGATDGDTEILDDTTGTMADEEESGEPTLADSDFMIGYNPYTGDYEVYDTEELLTSNVTSESKNSTMERFIEELLKAEDEADGENNFVVRKLASNVLSTDERNGFILLSIIALSCIIVLIVMHVKVRKR